MSSSNTRSDLTRLVVLPQWHDERVDVYLAGATDLSRRAARRLLADGRVRRNGDPLRVQSRQMITGDVIDVLLPPSELGTPRIPNVAPPTFLHQDRWLLAADKPSGVLSQSAETAAMNEMPFDSQVLVALAVEAGSRPFLRMIHRLDRVTSGAVLFARNREALPKITHLWADGLVQRLYLAVVEGHPAFKECEIDRPIGRDRNHTWRFMCDQTGKAAQTGVQLLAHLEGGLSVVLCRLITGRTHQVRVHLADVGHPVLGDRLYGSQRPDEAPRPLLHALSLALPHPSTGEPLKIVSTPPEDFEVFLSDPRIDPADVL